MENNKKNNIIKTKLVDFLVEQNETLNGGDSMKELIIQTLNEAFVTLERRTPQTKSEAVYVNIEDVSPFDIVEFMKDNNIPDTASFSGKPNSYDAFDEVCLSYDIQVPTNDKEKLKYKRHMFNTIAFKSLQEVLTKNGYKIVGFSSGLLKEFDDTTVYDMYMNKEFDRLVKYYSLRFIKE